MKTPETPTIDQDRFCSTSSAATILGLSVSAVQILVDANKLTAWKTQGGHRRISLKSIINYQKENNFNLDKNSHIEDATQVLIVEDDENTRNMYEAYFSQWNLPLEVVIYASALEALVDLHLLTPMVLLTDLHMSKMDGFEFIKVVREYKQFSNLPIIAITGMTNEKIHTNGGLDGDVLILQKPIDMKWLKGFLQGIISIKTD